MGLTVGEVKTAKRILYQYFNISDTTDDATLKALIRKPFVINPSYASQNEPIHYASQQGRIDVIKSLLALGADVNAVGENRLTPLSIAAMRGDEATVKFLISNKATFTSEYKQYTPLHFAANNGHLGVIKILLSAGMDVNVADSNQITALYLATQKGNKDIVNFLLSKHANVNVKDYHFNWSPIHLTILSNNYVMLLESLLRAGADINAIGDRGRTALHLAVQSGYEDAVKLLLSYNAKIDFKDNWRRTPLYIAVVNGYTNIVKILFAQEDLPEITIIKYISYAISRNYMDIMKAFLARAAKLNNTSLFLFNKALAKKNLEAVKLLIAYGADIGVQDENGFTPLLLAIISENKDVVKIYLEVGDNKTHNIYGNIVNVPHSVVVTTKQNNTEVHTLTPLHLATHIGSLEIVKLLISHGAGVNAKDERGYTPLHYACSNGYIDIVSVLLKSNVDKDIIDNEGTTPLHIASRKGFMNIIKLLFSAPPASVKIRDDGGNTALHEATWSGYKDIVTLLLETGADKEAKNNKFESPLFQASFAGYTEIVEILLNAGSDVEAADRSGKTPLLVACREGHSEVVQLLLKNGANTTGDEYGNNPLHYVAMKRLQTTRKRSEGPTEESSKLRIVEMLYKLNLHYQRANNNHIKPIHIASSNGFLELAKLFPPNPFHAEKDGNGCTPLYHAALNGRNNIVEWLLAEGVNINDINNKYETPLIVSSKEGHTEVVKTLLESFADTDMADIDGRTALHFASGYGHTAIVRHLILNLAASFVKDKWGWTPLNYAASWRGHLDVVKLLLEL